MSIVKLVSHFSLYEYKTTKLFKRQGLEFVDVKFKKKKKRISN